MASTYSTNLALELIGTGDQAGTWGVTTNTNLGTLLEQSISGYVTQAITDGADTTITIPNGASGVARNMVIEMTGALTATRNLIVPANRKLYFIYNNTTGGFAVTVKVTGLTGVSVPNGSKVVLVSNGTDIVEQFNRVVGAFGVSGASTLATTTVTALTATSDSTFSSTGAVTVSKGTTAQRPASPASGMFRFNTTTAEFEGYNGTAFASVGGAALSNDTSTASNLFPLFASATSGSASSLFTSNAKLLYKPSTGELKVDVPIAGNGITVNSTTVAASYTIASGTNGFSVGPITVNSGVTVTIAAGQRWYVI